MISLYIIILGFALFFVVKWIDYHIRNNLLNIALLKPEEVRRIKSSFDYDAEVYNLEKLEDTLKTEQVDEVENEDVFDLLIDTPKIGGEKDDALKSKYDFEDIIHEK